jgi:hypothetical protein
MIGHSLACSHLVLEDDHHIREDDSAEDDVRNRVSRSLKCEFARKIVLCLCRSHILCSASLFKKALLRSFFWRCIFFSRRLCLALCSLASKNEI